MSSFTLAAVANAAIALLANTASAHLIMQKPVPFGVDSLDNSPLEDAFPGNYPCKQRTGVYDITTMNFMKVGDPQELSFEGSASHGGGTCQIAVSLDTEPTPNSTFKIIQVFEGGCPVSSDGNTGTHPFTFTIPEGFPNGVSTMAWFWNNRVGNREAYMNCAPITVSGGSDSLDYYDSLPNLFLANLPSSECEVPESASLKVPNGGQFVLQAPQESLIAPSGPKCSAYAASQTEGVKGYQSATKANIAAYKAPAGAAGSTGKPEPNATPASELGGGSGGGGAPAATTAPAGPPSGTAPSAGGQPKPPPAGMDGGYSASATSAAAGSAPVTMSTAVSSAAAAPPSSAAAAPPSSAAAPPASSAPAAAPSSYAAQPSSAGVAAPSAGAASPSGSYGSGSTSSGGSCSSSSGGIECSSDGSQFGMCTAGGEMVWQKVAAGTKCQNGGIVKRDEVVELAPEFRNPHVRRHVRGAGVHKKFEF